MPAEDRKSMAGFYTKVFGWKTEQLGEDMGNYVLATTTESDEKGPKNPGAINGGFFQKTDDKPSQYPSIVIAVEDVKQHMMKVEKEGGRVLGEPWDTRSGTIAAESSIPKLSFPAVFLYRLAPH